MWIHEDANDEEAAARNVKKYSKTSDYDWKMQLKKRTDQNQLIKEVKNK